MLSLIKHTDDKARYPSRIKKKKIFIQTHNSKTAAPQDEDNIFKKKNNEKKIVPCKRPTINMAADLSSATIKTRRQ